LYSRSRMPSSAHTLFGKHNARGVIAESHVAGAVRGGVCGLAPAVGGPLYTYQESRTPVSRFSTAQILRGAYSMPSLAHRHDGDSACARRDARTSQPAPGSHRLRYPAASARQAATLWPISAGGSVHPARSSRHGRRGVPGHGAGWAERPISWGQQRVFLHERHEAGVALVHQGHLHRLAGGLLHRRGQRRDLRPIPLTGRRDHERQQVPQGVHRQVDRTPPPPLVAVVVGTRPALRARLPGPAVEDRRRRLGDASPDSACKYICRSYWSA